MQYKDMKNLKVLTNCLILGLMVVVMSACEQVDGYTVKTSQTIAEISIPDSTYYRALTSETGRMTINRNGKGDADITFRLTNGDAISTEAEVNGKDIKLDPFTYTLKLKSNGLLGDVKEDVFEVEVSGNGKMTGDQIIFTLDYEGKEINNSKKSLKAENVTWICTHDM